MKLLHPIKKSPADGTTSGRNPARFPAHRLFALTRGTALLTLLAAALLVTGCSKGNVKAEESRIPFRPWGILGAKIVDAREGVTITEVIRNSSAEVAGLRVGDVILSVSGAPQLRAEILIDHIRSRLPGSAIEVEYARRGIRSTTLITVGEYPSDEQIWSMASAAAKALDFERALILCQYFEKTIPPQSRHTAPIRELQASVVRAIAEK